jgi:excisionase family DNA binding protein
MLLTVQEAATLMRVSARTVRRQVAIGELKGQRVGRQIRLPLDQFSHLVDTKSVAAEVAQRIRAANEAEIRRAQEALKASRPKAVDAEEELL